MVIGGAAMPDRMMRVDAPVSGSQAAASIPAHRHWPGTNVAIMAGVTAIPADTRANLWNLSPDERAGQSGGRPVTVMKYIAPSDRFFQTEIGGPETVPDTGLTGIVDLTLQQ